MSKNLQDILAQIAKFQADATSVNTRVRIPGSGSSVGPTTGGNVDLPAPTALSQHRPRYDKAMGAISNALPVLAAANAAKDGWHTAMSGSPYLGAGIMAASVLPEVGSVVGAGAHLAESAARTAFNEVSPEAFHDAVGAFSAARPSEAGFLTHRTPDAMRAEQMRTFLSPDAKTGYALGPLDANRTDIRNVFNHGPKGAGAHAVADAIGNGGNVLDHFDTKLGNVYRDFGFKEYTPPGETSARMPWNEDYKPAGWDSAKHGTPDVVNQMHPGGTADEVLSQYATNKAHREIGDVLAKHADLAAGDAAGAGLVSAPRASGPVAPPAGYPAQTDLARVIKQRVPQGRVDDVEEEALKTYKGSKFEGWLRDGNFGDWYHTQDTEQKAKDALGDEEGGAGFKRLMEMIGATTARSDPGNNLRRASYYRGLENAGLLDNEALRTAGYKKVPSGMGHLANNAHHSGLAGLMEQGEISPLTNPKPAAFVQNLERNMLPFTNDTRMATGAALANPKLLDMGAVIKSVTKAKKPGMADAVTYSPRDWAYAPMERAAQEAAKHYAERGMLDVPGGVAPTADWQAKVWDGLSSIIPGASPSQGKFSDVFNAKLAKNAKAWGMSEEAANKLFWEGHPFDLPLKTNLVPKGLLDRF